MGEIADMMLDGDLCEGCGEYLGDGEGYARKCVGCRRDEKLKPVKKQAKKGQKNEQNTKTT